MATRRGGSTEAVTIRWQGKAFSVTDVFGSPTVEVSAEAHEGRPTFLTSRANRGSARKPSNVGSTLKVNIGHGRST